METPVLFLIFNRPDSTIEVFNAIRTAKPKRLYIAADGPRPSRPEEKRLCEQARAIASNVDWDCVVYTLFRNENLGCKIAVSNAINWFFDHEEEGIILEDDILPHPEFFNYCEELLERYRENESIGVISGHNHVYDSSVFNGCSYDFVAISHCWGWATWRKSWQTVDIELNKYSARDLNNSLKSLYPISKFRYFWKAIFNLMKLNMINSWAYPMSLSFIINKKLSIIPAINLTKNIGDGNEATHTLELNNNEKGIVLRNIYPLTHPKNVQLNELAENKEIENENRILSRFQYLKLKISLIRHRIKR